jgi:hypothetical protein
MDFERKSVKFFPGSHFSPLKNILQIGHYFVIAKSHYSISELVELCCLNYVVFYLLDVNLSIKRGVLYPIEFHAQGESQIRVECLLPPLPYPIA